MAKSHIKGHKMFPSLAFIPQSPSASRGTKSRNPFSSLALSAASAIHGCKFSMNQYDTNIAIDLLVDEKKRTERMLKNHQSSTGVNTNTALNI